MFKFVLFLIKSFIISTLFLAAATSNGVVEFFFDFGLFMFVLSLRSLCVLIIFLFVIVVCSVFVFFVCVVFFFNIFFDGFLFILNIFFVVFFFGVFVLFLEFVFLGLGGGLFYE